MFPGWCVDCKPSVKTILLMGKNKRENKTCLNNSPEHKYVWFREVAFSTSPYLFVKSPACNLSGVFPLSHSSKTPLLWVLPWVSSQYDLSPKCCQCNPSSSNYTDPQKFTQQNQPDILSFSIANLNKNNPNINMTGWKTKHLKMYLHLFHGHVSFGKDSLPNLSEKACR